MLRWKKRALPGLGLTLGTTGVYLALIVLLPVAALLMKAASLTPSEFFAIISSPRALASFRITLSAALYATLFNGVFGLLLAWILVRYDFPGRRLLDALVDLPFALPTAVAGIALTALLAKNGWVGQYLEPLGFKIAYAPAGIAVAMAFTSLPFIVRSVQPVLEDLDIDSNGRSRPIIRRKRSRDLPTRDFSRDPARLPCRLHIGFCPQPRRIRRGDFHCRQHPAANRNHGIAHLHPS